tara:strand:- start:610 stop:1113 length:504 start_codon:yes stop_codon:yes gene_type:complete
MHIASVVLIATTSTAVKMYMEYLKSKKWINPVTSKVVKIPKNLFSYNPEDKKSLIEFSSKDKSTIILLRGFEFPDQVKLDDLIEYKLKKMKEEYEGFDKFFHSFKTIGNKTVSVLKKTEKTYPFETQHTIFTWIDDDKIELNLTSVETFSNTYVNSDTFKNSLINSF